MRPGRRSLDERLSRGLCKVWRFLSRVFHWETRGVSESYDVACLRFEAIPLVVRVGNATN